MSRVIWWTILLALRFEFIQCWSWLANCRRNNCILLHSLSRFAFFFRCRNRFVRLCGIGEHLLTSSTGKRGHMKRFTFFSMSIFILFLFVFISMSDGHRSIDRISNSRSWFFASAKQSLLANRWIFSLFAQVRNECRWFLLWSAFNIIIYMLKLMPTISN